MHYKFLIATFALFVVNPAFAQNEPAFEVASVKPADLSERLRTHSSHIGAKIDGARADFGAMSLRSLIGFAFRIKSFQITGATTDLSTTAFDIVAKLPYGESPDRVPEMLQQLLAERFRLAFHWDRKEIPVYALVVGPKGAKLARPPADFDLQAARAVSMYKQVVPMSLERLVGAVSSFLGKPVVNQTGMDGEFMIPLGRLTTINSERFKAEIAAHSGGEATAWVPDNSPVHALLSDLGLKVENRNVPFPVLVIDKLEKTPTEQ